MRAYSMTAAVALLAAVGGGAFGQSNDRGGSGRVVLVELFTSQGCDMCPEAERVLGELAGRNPRVVTVAFHVDYFNNPWKDPFSDAVNSKRQAEYNSIYTKPKNPEYGLYYTPMMMVDGEQTINGRDPDGAAVAIRQALAVKPQVSLKAALTLKGDSRSGDVRVKVASRSILAEGREVLVCAVLRDDRVVTKVLSGENANKTLTARFPARTMKFESARLVGKKDVTVTFPFQLDPAWKSEELGVVVFVQDKKTGVVYQSALVAWKTPDHPAPSGIK